MSLKSIYTTDHMRLHRPSVSGNRPQSPCCWPEALNILKSYSGLKPLDQYGVHTGGFEPPDPIWGTCYGVRLTTSNYACFFDQQLLRASWTITF